MTEHHFVGNLTADPELRTTTTDKSVAEFRIAVSDRYRDAQGTWVETEPVYWPVQIWGEPAKAVKAHLRTGSKVIVVGELRNQAWEDPQTKEKKSRRLIQARYVGPALGDQPRSHTAQPGTTNSQSAPTGVADPQWADA
ncbi:single-stranded DNA-binding protein (plasmid) [Kribbella sp. CA-253562]|uniref:single-stranded DNA-binding protein n=1 Tax=Kribbella sp. CA-253562 TaxID=3239942 RepID=UPI003D8F2AAF